MKPKKIQIFTGLFVQYNDGRQFIYEMKQRYPAFDPSDFIYIVQIAYPIVFLEVEVLERTMEDFSVVEKTILKLVKDGITDTNVITRLLGLPQSYVAKMLRLLNALDLTDERGITSQGLLSLENNAIVKKNVVKQKIQVDGLTGEPVRVNAFIDNQMLKTPKESGRFVVHLEPIEGVDESWLEDLIRTNYSNYVNKGEATLHTNVEEIRNVRFLEMKYAKSFFLENGERDYLILCKSFDTTARSFIDRYVFRSLYASNHSFEERYGIPMRNSDVLGTAPQKIEDLKERLSSNRTHDENVVIQMLNQLYGFDWSFTTLTKDISFTLNISMESFRDYDKFVLKLLESIATDQKDYIIFEELYGEYITVKTDDASLMEMAVRYVQKCEKLGRTYIMNSMEKYSKKNNGSMFSVLESILDNERKEADNK